MPQPEQHQATGSQRRTKSHNDNGDRWFVVQTHRHAESLAEENLRQQNFSTYLPKRQRTVRHARRIRTVLSAYFDCYLFVSFDAERQSWYPINSTVGVRRLIMNGGVPVPVPHGVVESLISATDEKGILRPGSLLQSGKKVRVAVGVFADQLGTLDYVGRSGAVRILMSIMNRSVPVHIDSDKILIIS